MSRASPPLPRCAFRVAIVGHRPDRLAIEAVPTLMAHLRSAFTVIRDEVHRVTELAASGYAPDPPDLVVLTGLAAGADQLGAKAALATPGWRLHAVLPFDQEEYERDFTDDPSARREFHRLIEQASDVTVLDGRARTGPDGDRAFDAYAPLAQVLVDQCDLLTVVWDGAPARGVGGTAMMVQAARAADVPILHLNPRKPRTVLLESRPEFGGGDDWGASLRQQVARLLAPPDLATTHGGENLDLRQQYFEERLPGKRRATLFDLVGAAFHRGAGERGRLPRMAQTLLRMLHGVPVPDPTKVTEATWNAMWQDMPLPVRGAAMERFAAHHGWADTLANHYAAAFRATYSRVFAFAWLAVLAAFTGTVAESWGGYGSLSRVGELVHGVCLGAEALILLVVFANVYWGRRGRFHERWLDYRALAERLRHLAVLWPLGRTTAAVRLPAIVLSGDPRTSWVGWYLRSVAREAGLVTGVFDRRHIEASRSLLRNGELEQQRSFHESARDRGHAIVHPLERAAEGLFLVALLVALANLLHWPERLLASLVVHPATPAAILGAIGVGLPALASAVHGFLGTSDMESIAIRSAGVAPRLRELVWRLDHLDPVDSSSIGEIGTEAARVMEGELGSWRAVTAARKLTAV